MEYCVATEKRGIMLKPGRKWNGDPKFELIILGRSDLNFAKEPDTRKSVFNKVQCRKLWICPSSRRNCSRLCSGHDVREAYFGIDAA
jgi:hypothetical protein